jgi:hypothetical protein
VQAEGSFSIRGALKDLAAYQAKRRVENILSKIDAQQKALAENKKNDGEKDSKSSIDTHEIDKEQ